LKGFAHFKTKITHGGHAVKIGSPTTMERFCIKSGKERKRAAILQKIQTGNDFSPFLTENKKKLEPKIANRKS